MEPGMGGVAAGAAAGGTAGALIFGRERWVPVEPVR